MVGYGIGPLFLAPITEIPQIGRNLPYIVPLAIFCLLQIPTALVENFAGFCVLRFIAGFVSSPPLATGGESLLLSSISPHSLDSPLSCHSISVSYTQSHQQVEDSPLPFKTKKANVKARSGLMNQEHPYSTSFPNGK